MPSFDPDDLQLFELLGEGGSGNVYRGELWGKEVAVKVLKPELSAKEKRREQFMREARHLALVKHSGLVSLLGIGTTQEGEPCFVMPLFRGVTLATRLEGGPLPKDTALRIFNRLADAVAAIHDAGLVHRDIKPENIAFDHDDNPILLDFGIAREINAAKTTTEGMVRGTPAYMAPERLFGAAASVASDIYELAVVLYAMLTGGVPWRDSTEPSDRLAPRRPSELGVPLPRAFETTLLQAMSARTELRPASVRTFASDLQHAEQGAGGGRITGEMTLQERPSASPPPTGPRARIPVVGLRTLLLLAATASAMIGLSAMLTRHTDRVPALTARSSLMPFVHRWSAVLTSTREAWAKVRATASDNTPKSEPVHAIGQRSVRSAASAKPHGASSPNLATTVAPVRTATKSQPAEPFQGTSETAQPNHPGTFDARF